MKKMISAGMISTDKSLDKRAESLADEISEFLNDTTKIDNLSDFLDSDDLEALGKAQDALYFFARTYK